MKKMLISLLFFVANFAYGNDFYQVRFFVSNNTKEINLQTAYARLTGSEQVALQNKIRDLLQEKHLKLTGVENILGTYRMSTDKNITADNTESFTSYLISKEQAFALAKALAQRLNQDSVAVLIRNKNTLADVTVNVTSKQNNINQVIKLIHDKLSTTYNQAFSLHLINSPGEFKNAKVTSIEWLGNKIRLTDIHKAFPKAKVTTANGSVFLIYKDGHQEQL